MTDQITETPEQEPVDQGQVNPLELSDEEFDKLVPSEFIPGQVADEETSDEGEDSKQEAVESEEEPEADLGTESTEQGEETDSDTGSDSADTSDPGRTEAETAEEDSQPEKKADKDGTDAAPLVDYKAEYEKLMAPFKANGMDMQAKSVDDAIQLMQMGAGFHKKMTALKPAIRQMKLLEKNGLLDDDKLNYLIDLHKKNPEAIQKLLKDSNLDPLDIDLKAENNYTPTNRKVTDTEIALDDVINDIRDTPTFQRTLTVISKEWDDSSQDAIANEPQIISTINGHMQDGTFDAVMQRVNYERSLGRLSGVSDIQAYMQMGNAMADEGKLNRVGAPQQQQQQAQPIQPQQVEPSTQEIERKKKKRAASPVKTARTSAEPLLNPLELSDEEFAKLDINKYIKS